MDCRDRAQLLDRFSVAWGAGDIDALMALMTENCMFRASVGPEPGATFSGSDDVRRGFSLFIGSGGTDPGVQTDTQDPLISADFAVTRWTSRYPRPDGAAVVVTACDILGFEGDLINFKDTYRKVTGDLPPA
jgi:ketosteroid isomerase-like protein